MKNSSQKKLFGKQKPGKSNEVGGLDGAEYCINFRVGIPFGIDDGEKRAGDVARVTDFVLAALKAAKAEGIDVTLEHSTFVGTRAQMIPIIPVQDGR